MRTQWSNSWKTLSKEEEVHHQSSNCLKTFYIYLDLGWKCKDHNPKYPTQGKLKCSELGM